MGDGENGRWGDGGMGRMGDGENGRWGDGEMGSFLRVGEWGRLGSFLRLLLTQRRKPRVDLGEKEYILFTYYSLLITYYLTKSRENYIREER